MPSRLGLMLAEDGLVPPWMGAVSACTGTPILGLTATLGIALVILLIGHRFSARPAEAGVHLVHPP